MTRIELEPVDRVCVTILIEEMSFEVEGDLDLRSFFGVSDDERPGFSEIRAKATVKSSGASVEELQDLCFYVQDTSPVKDVLANPVQVTTTIEVIG